MDNYDFEMIPEPLLTEEGFINEACINALNSAIANTPPTYERLANDLEWTKKYWTFQHDIVAAFAKWAVRISPYAYPDHLIEVLGYLDACLKRMIEWDKDGMYKLSLCDINKLLHDILMDKGITYFDDWNKPKKDWRKDNKESFQEATDKDPDYDFIDLHALLHNVCLDLRTEHREKDSFDEKFEKEWQDKGNK